MLRREGIPGIHLYEGKRKSKGLKEERVWVVVKSSRRAGSFRKAGRHCERSRRESEYSSTEYIQNRPILRPLGQPKPSVTGMRSFFSILARSTR